MIENVCAKGNNCSLSHDNAVLVKGLSDTLLKIDKSKYKPSSIMIKSLVIIIII